MEALRGALHEHKENVEASISGGKVAYSGGKAHTPAGKLNPYSTPKSMKVTGKSSSTSKKPRRALGDISNQHRTPNGNNSNTSVLGKRTNENKLKAKSKLTTPASAKKAAGAAVKVATPSRASPAVENVEEIEFAYGGLPSYGPDPAYLERIRNEIVREIYDDTTPSVMDQYEIEDKSSNQWNRDISLLASGAAPSPWWSTEEPAESSFAETITWSDDSIPSTVDLNALEPDSTDLQPEDKDDLLDEILNLDIPVSVE